MNEQESPAHIRRLKSLARDISQLDLDDPDLIDRLVVLRARAQRAITQSKISPQERAEMTQQARTLASQSLRRIGRESTDRYMPFIREAIKRGAVGYSAIARELDKVGVKPPRTETWSPASVRAIMMRVGEGLYET